MNRDDCLPSAWASALLGDVAVLNPSLPDAVPHDDELVSFIPMPAVEVGTGRMDPSQARKWSEVRRGFTRFQEGDVLFAKITPSMENGKAALAAGLVGGRGAGSTEFHVLRCTDVVDPKFLLYYLLQETFRRDARMKMKGVAGQLRVPPEFMAQATMPIAPLPEQRRIVAEIEKHVTRLDAAVAALERARANLKRYRASVLKAACEGRLVPTEADDHDRPGLPEGWRLRKIRDLGKVQLGRQRSPKNRSDRYPTKYIRAANITWSGLDLSDVLDMDFNPKERETYRLLPGDLVVAEASGSADQVGKPAVWSAELPECCFQNTVIRLRPDPCVFSKFALIVFAHYARNGTFSSASSGVGIHHLSAARFTDLPFPLPPLGEQERIVAEVDARLSLVEQLDIVIDHALRRAARLRQSILKRAFEGKLVPQDPNDEPASVLLERIRAQREPEVGAARPVRARGRRVAMRTRHGKGEER